MNIEYFKSKNEVKPYFSILIPTWNNIEYLKLCIASIKNNSKFPHQIIIHINENEDNTKEWVVNAGYSYTYSKENIGICYGMNAAFSLADSDYILYLNDDMYVCPEWDLYLWNEIQKHKNTNYYISATLIEPVNSGNVSVLAPFNFGQSIEEFNENALLEQINKIEKADWQGSTWPPSLVHRKTWELIGGFSTEFSPGMYSDSDFAMKLWKAGIRYFKGIGKSKVYHFMSKSTGKVRKNNGRKQFLLKWRMSSSTFYKHYLRMGNNFLGVVSEPKLTLKLKLKKIKDKLKLIIAN